MRGMLIVIEALGDTQRKVQEIRHPSHVNGFFRQSVQAIGDMDVDVDQ